MSQHYAALGTVVAGAVIISIMPVIPGMPGRLRGLGGEVLSCLPRPYADVPWFLGLLLGVLLVLRQASSVAVGTLRPIRSRAHHI